MLEVLNIVGAILIGLVGATIIAIVGYAFVCFAVMAYKKIKEIGKE